MKKIWGLAVVIAGFISGLAWWKTRKKEPVKFVTKKIQKTAQDHTWLAFFKARPEATWLMVGAIALLFFGDVFQRYSFVFKASLLSLPQTEFTGTNMPVKKVPIWTELTEAERKMTYQQLPKSKIMDLPPYDLNAMQNGQEWRPDNADARNIYVTYPVPNLGNYNLDGTENSGSHPGIDIKIPIGTPIHAIANGVVYKVQNKTTGFGKSVSIAHVGVPDPKNQNEKITLVSTYAHLSNFNVKEGQKVAKDQVIGASGDTGFATAPHIHFQIDRDDAPFIPYWPFSWNEANKAGYSSTFEAVRAGYGKQKAIKYTVHPVNFISKFKGFSNEENLVVQNGEADNVIIKTEPVEVKTEEIELAEVAPDFSEEVVNKEIIKEVIEEPKSSAPAEDNRIIKKEEVSQTLSDKITVEIITDRNYIPGEKEVVRINVNASALIDTPIQLSSTLKNRAQITPTELLAKDFVNNTAEVEVTTESQYPFKIVAEGDFGKEKSDSLRPEVFIDVPATHMYADAIKSLREKEVVKGYDDGTFKPGSTLNRAEALKIILEANNFEIVGNKNNFPDVNPNDWFAGYVNTAFTKGIVKGYSDGNFKPANTVSRAEFLKMAILTAGFEPVQDQNQTSYPDVDKSAWFAVFFQFGKDNEILRMKKGGFIVPNDPINRGEAADVIYRLGQLEKR